MIEYKTIGHTSAELLFQLHQMDQSFFTIEQAAQLLGERSAASTRRLLADMVRRGLLMRLREGLYHIIPYESDPTTYFPNWHVAAHHLVGETPYYIGYYSAMVLHNHNPQHFFGITQKWIENIYQVYCSDLEKTLLDVAFKPNYGCGITELAKALYKSKDILNEMLLLNYVDRFHSDASIRRLGFLMQILGIHPQLVALLHQKLPKTSTYVALDTGLPKMGRNISRWGIVLNIDLETIENALFT